MGRRCTDKNTRPKPRRNTDWVDNILEEFGIKKNKRNKKCGDKNGRHNGRTF